MEEANGQVSILEAWQTESFRLLDGLKSDRDVLLRAAEGMKSQLEETEKRLSAAKEENRQIREGAARYLDAGLRDVRAEYQSLLAEHNKLIAQWNSEMNQRQQEQQNRMQRFNPDAITNSGFQNDRRKSSGSSSNMHGPYHVGAGGTVTGPDGKMYRVDTGGMVIELNP